MNSSTFRTVAALGCMALLAPAAARAQNAPADSTRVEAAPQAVSTAAAMRPLSIGDTVRMVSGAGRYLGRITAVTRDTFTLAASGRTDAVPRTSIVEMHRLVSRERRGITILRGAGVGLLAGAALGFVSGTAAGRIECPPDDTACVPGSRRDKTIKAALTVDGAIVGALIGAMVGPNFRRTRWERVDPAPSPQMGMAVTPLPAP